MPVVDIPFRSAALTVTWPEAALVGGGDAVADDSDATYAQVSARGIFQDNQIQHRWDFLRGTLDKTLLASTLAEASASGAPTVSRQLVIRLAFPNWSSAIHGTSAPAPRFCTNNTTWAFISFGPPASNRTGVYESAAGLSQTLVNDIVADGQGFFHPYNFAQYLDHTKPNGGSLVAQIYRASVRVAWTPPDLTKPVARLYPRDDGRGASSAPRMVPTPRAARLVSGHQ